VHFLGDVLLNLAGWANFRDLVAGFSPLFSSVDDPIDICANRIGSRHFSV
jgi:hypothetical protein